MTHGFGSCPQCSSRMVVERLSCWRCGTEVTGRLGVPLLARLPAELADFVRELLLANGSLSATQERMGCSYPKVRRLLDDVMATLRKEIEADLVAKEDVLGALEAGRLEAAEAVKLIRGLAGKEAP